jgi:hypothetical protein
MVMDTPVWPGLAVLRVDEAVFLRGKYAAGPIHPRQRMEHLQHVVVVVHDRPDDSAGVVPRCAARREVGGRLECITSSIAVDRRKLPNTIRMSPQIRKTIVF